jgi:hypothetical protein
VFLVFTVLGLTAARMALFWSLALVPVWARWIDQALPADLFRPREDATRPPAWLWPTVIGAEIVVVLLLFVRGPVFDREIPLAGLAELKKVLPAGRIYNYREWGGPLILAGQPEWQVAIDGRLYLYTIDTWNEYNRAAGGQVPLKELVATHQPDAFFLRPDFDAGLVKLLRESKEWREVYAAEFCIIFIRRR